MAVTMGVQCLMTNGRAQNGCEPDMKMWSRLLSLLEKERSFRNWPEQGLLPVTDPSEDKTQTCNCNLQVAEAGI